MTDPTEEWLDANVAEFRRRRPLYVRYTSWMESLLSDAMSVLAPTAIVRVRTKEVASFAEKCLRKREGIDEPISQFTDFCGARVIMTTGDEIGLAREWLISKFSVDWANSDDTIDRLGAHEFGYRSIHYIVSPPPDAPAEFCGLKAEVQLRTLLQHAWAEGMHDIHYKAKFKVPKLWQREIAILAAELEDADAALSQIQRSLRLFETSYGRQLSQEEADAELAILNTVLKHDDQNVVVAWRAGKLAMTLGDWSRAIELMSPHVDPERPETVYQPLVRDLGVSLCKEHEAAQSSGFERGQKYLTVAAAEPHRDADALAALAGTYKGRDDSKALELYRAAFELDPHDYYALGNYLEAELFQACDHRLLGPLGPTIDGAIERCLAHVQAGVNLPWALFSLGELQLLRDRAELAVLAYADGISASTTPWMTEAALESLDRLQACGLEFEALAAARWLLTLACTSQAGPPGRIHTYAKEGVAPLRGPRVVVFIADTANLTPDVIAKALKTSFAQLSVAPWGTVISSCTQPESHVIVGQLVAGLGNAVQHVGYGPTIPPLGHTHDGPSSDFRLVNGRDLAAERPLRYWTDILNSGLKPSEVDLLVSDASPATGLETAIGRSLGAERVVDLAQSAPGSAG